MPNGVDLSFWVARPERSGGRGLLRARKTHFELCLTPFSLAFPHHPCAIGTPLGPVLNGVDLSFWVARPERSEGRGLLRACKTHFELCVA